MSVDTVENATAKTAKTAKAAKLPGETTLPAMPADVKGDTAESTSPGRTKAAWSGEINHDVEVGRTINRTANGMTDVITFAVYVPQYDRVINVSMSADDAGKHVDALTAVLDD